MECNVGLHGICLCDMEHENMHHTQCVLAESIVTCSQVVIYMNWSCVASQSSHAYVCMEPKTESIQLKPVLKWD